MWDPLIVDNCSGESDQGEGDRLDWPKWAIMMFFIQILYLILLIIISTWIKATVQCNHLCVLLGAFKCSNQWTFPAVFYITWLGVTHFLTHTDRETQTFIGMDAFFGSVRSSRCHNVWSVCPAQVCLKHWIFNLSLSGLSQVSLSSLSALLAYFVRQTKPKILRLVSYHMIESVQ